MNPAFESDEKLMEMVETILFLREEITKKDLNDVEKFADKLFKKFDIDVEFTKHFLERCNDARNGKPITVSELIRLFKQTFAQAGKKIAEMGADAQAVITDLQTDLNLPFVLNYDPKNKELELVSKTILRKKNFSTSNDKIAIK